MTTVREWTVVLRGDWYLPHLINMLDEYRGNAEQRLCVDEMIAQIRSQILTANGVGHETTRPLVVIDPEDREQVERLAKCYRDVHGEAELTDEPWSVPGLRMQAALRDFADPIEPKPDEPLGLGAVVEDSDGDRWVRTDKGVNVWSNGRDGDPSDGDFARVRLRPWADLSVVRVLSEGVADV